MSSRKPLMMLITTCVVLMMMFAGVGYAYTAISINDNNNANPNYVTITQEGSGIGAYTFGDAEIRYDLISTRYVETWYVLKEYVEIQVGQDLYRGVPADQNLPLNITATAEGDYQIKIWHLVSDAGEWKAVIHYWPEGQNEDYAVANNLVAAVDYTEVNAVTLNLHLNAGTNTYYFRGYTSAINGESKDMLPVSVLTSGARFVVSTEEQGVTFPEPYPDNEYGPGFKITRTHHVQYAVETRDVPQSLTSVYKLKPALTSDLTVGQDVYKVVKFGGEQSYQILRVAEQTTGSHQTSYDVFTWYDPSTFPAMGGWKMIMEYWTDNEGATDVGVHKTFVLGAGENNSNQMTLYPGTNGDVVYKVKLYFGSIGGTSYTRPPLNSASDGSIIFKCTVG